MKVTVLKAIGHLTIQDRGRPGQRHAGLPLGGPADRESAILANRLVGNPDLAPMVELALAKADLFFDRDCGLAWTGARVALSVDGQPQGLDRTIICPASVKVSIEGFRYGNYGYLAIGGAWAAARWRGSTSPVLLGDAAHPASSVLRTGASFEVLPSETRLRSAPCLLPSEAETPTVIRISTGPETSRFEAGLGFRAGGGLAGTHLLLGLPFTVDPASDRVGVRLRGTGSLALRPAIFGPEVRSSPTLPGTIQVLPNGDLIVGHVDGPTMGGYPRIGIVVPEDLGLLAQARGGVTFVAAA